MAGSGPCRGSASAVSDGAGPWRRRRVSAWPGGWRRLASVGCWVGLEGGDPLLPGGVEVGARGEAPGELEQDHAVGERPHGPGLVEIAGGAQQRGGGTVLDAGGQQVAWQR